MATASSISCGDPSKQTPDSDTEANAELALGKGNMAQMFSILTQEEVDDFCAEYGIDKELHPTSPAADATITDMPLGTIGVYTRWFDFANIRFPISRFLLSVLQYYQVHISQISPVGLVKVSSFEIHCRALNGVPSLPLFRRFYTLSKNGDWLTIEKRKKPQPYHYLRAPDGSKDWKDRFFWVDARAVPIFMTWKNKTEVKLDPLPADGTFDQSLFERLQNPRVNVQTFPEHVLVMAGISQKWDKHDEVPVIRPSNSDEELPLVEFMRLWKCSDARFGSRPLREGEEAYPDRFCDAVVAANDEMLQLVEESFPDAPKMRRFKTKAKVRGSSARRTSTHGTKAAVGSSAIKSLPIGMNLGMQLGYSYVKMNMPIEKVPGYDALAADKLPRAEEELRNATYPFLELITANRDLPLVEFKKIILGINSAHGAA